MLRFYCSTLKHVLCPDPMYSARLVVFHEGGQFGFLFGAKHDGGLRRRLLGGSGGGLGRLGDWPKAQGAVDGTGNKRAVVEEKSGNLVKMTFKNGLHLSRLCEETCQLQRKTTNNSYRQRPLSYELVLATREEVARRGCHAFDPLGMLENGLFFASLKTR